MWTERVGLAAGLKTVQILTRDKVWKNSNQNWKFNIKWMEKLITKV